jgi:long-chain acyl-CoA synthetase
VSTQATDASPAWGTDIVEETVAGHRRRVYRHRRRHVGDLLSDLVRWGDRTALVQGTRRISYREHVGHVELVAAQLIRRGVTQGSRVMLLAANSPEWVTAYWAVFAAGGVAVPGNAWWSEAEVAHAVTTVKPDVVFADASAARLLPPGVEVLEQREVRALIESGSLSKPAVSPPPPDEDDPAMILFTSGTMGAAKGVLLSHRAVIANVHNLLVRTNRLPSTLSDDHVGTVSMMCLPLFHIGGLQSLMAGQLSGGRMLFLDGRFDPVEVLALIERERVRFFGGVPTMVSRVLDCPKIGEFDTSSLVSIAMGGSVVVPELAERIKRGFPSASRSITSVYGQTEAGGALTSANGTDLLDRPGCVGRPLPVAEIRIANPDPDGVGEVIAQSPTLMMGFVGDDQSDGSSTGPIDAAGWLHTGDLGRFDDDGYLYIVGRSREIIIRGGENIAPGHVENCLLQHAAVADVAVVGLPHPSLGEEVGAAVVLKPAATVDPAELRSHAAKMIARFEVPTRWWLRTEALPLNAAGKVVKRDLISHWTDEPPTEERATQ